MPDQRNHVECGLLWIEQRAMCRRREDAPMRGEWWGQGL
jgi:hypothetical protein